MPSDDTKAVEKLVTLHREKYARVQQMILDDGQTWGLSPNDKDALRHVLGLVNVMADEVAGFWGTTVADVFRAMGVTVQSVQDNPSVRGG